MYFPKDLLNGYNRVENFFQSLNITFILWQEEYVIQLFYLLVVQSSGLIHVSLLSSSPWSSVSQRNIPEA